MRSCLLRVLRPLWRLPPAARAAAQVAIPQGPAPITGSLEAIQSGDVSGVTGTVTGTVTGIVPIDANTLYVGTVNGGVWKTTNGGTNWTPLTDNQASLRSPALPLTQPTRHVGPWSRELGNGRPGPYQRTSEADCRPGCSTARPVVPAGNR